MIYKLSCTPAMVESFIKMSGGYFNSFITLSAVINDGPNYRAVSNKGMSTQALQLARMKAEADWRKQRMECADSLYNSLVALRDSNILSQFGDDKAVSNFMDWTASLPIQLKISSAFAKLKVIDAKSLSSYLISLRINYSLYLYAFLITIEFSKYYDTSTGTFTEPLPKWLWGVSIIPNKEDVENLYKEYYKDFITYPPIPEIPADVLDSLKSIIADSPYCIEDILEYSDYLLPVDYKLLASGKVKLDNNFIDHLDKRQKDSRSLFQYSTDMIFSVLTKASLDECLRFYNLEFPTGAENGIRPALLTSVYKGELSLSDMLMIAGSENGIDNITNLF